MHTLPLCIHCHWPAAAQRFARTLKVMNSVPHGKFSTLSTIPVKRLIWCCLSTAFHLPQWNLKIHGQDKMQKSTGSARTKRDGTTGNPYYRSAVVWCTSL